MRKVLIIDTSILCVLLSVPGKETCGSDDDKWDKARVEARLQAEEAHGTIFVLPLATLIETGNHIAHAKTRTQRYPLARALAEIIIKVADESSPWAAFTHQSDLWNGDGLRELAANWPQKAAEKVSIGDVSIMLVANFYRKIRADVEILSGDADLLPVVPPASAPPHPRKRPL